MGLLDSIMAKMSTKDPYIAGILAQGAIKTITTGELDSALELNTLFQGALLALIYESAKEVTMQLPL